MGHVANAAKSLEDRLDTVYSVVAKNQQNLENFSFPDVESLQAFVKSCSLDLSGDIAKIVKVGAKPAELVKLAKSIQTTTTLYGKNIQKIDGDFAMLMANKYLAPALEDIQKVVATVISKEVLDAKNTEILKKAQTKWSNNKPEAIVECKKQAVIRLSTSKKALKDFLTDQKLLKRDSYEKLLKLLAKVESLPETQRNSTAKGLIPLVAQMADDLKRFAVTGTGTGLLKNEVSLADDAIEQVQKELSVLLVPSMMGKIASQAKEGLNQGK